MNAGSARRAEHSLEPLHSSVCIGLRRIDQPGLAARACIVSSSPFM